MFPLYIFFVVTFCVQLLFCVCFEGTLENGDRSVDAASFVPRMHQQQQIDQTSDQERSRMWRVLEARGSVADGNNLFDLQAFDVNSPSYYVNELEAAELTNTHIRSNDDEIGDIGRTRLKRQAPPGDVRVHNQGHSKTSDYGVVVVSMIT